MFQIKSPVSFLGHNQCTKSYDTKHDLLLRIDYVEIRVFLKKCESQTRLLIGMEGVE